MHFEPRCRLLATPVLPETLCIYDGDGKLGRRLVKKCVFILLWNFAFIWNYPVCLSVLKLAPAEYATKAVNSRYIYEKIRRFVSRTTTQNSVCHFTLLVCMSVPLIRKGPKSSDEKDLLQAVLMITTDFDDSTNRS